MAITGQEPPPEEALRHAFIKSLEDKLYDEARAKIVPAIEAEIRAAARDSVRRLGASIRSYHNHLENELVMQVSINGAPPEVVK